MADSGDLRIYESQAFPGATKEARIQAGITQAVIDGYPTFTVAKKDQPFNAGAITFNNAVRMTAEGYNPSEWNVRAYGATGDGVANDQTAIVAAINAANANSIYALAGNVVRFPAGKYSHNATIQVPVALNSGQVILRGDGMRVSYLYPTGPSTNFTAAPLYNVCLLFGAITPDAAGTTTNVTQYCGMEDLSSNGSLITSGSVVGVQFTEMQKGWIQNSIIEAFPNNSIGLYLRGSTVTGGLGTTTTAPHSWRNVFLNTIVSNIGSNNLGGRCVVLQNADENSFLNGVHQAVTGQTVAQDTIFTTWIQMGRNNLFDDVLQGGERTALKTGYVGMVFGPPQNEAGVANGSVLGNCDFGSVAEGFDICCWFQGDSSGNTLGNQVLAANPSIYNTAYRDDNPALLNGGAVGGGNGGNVYEAPLVSIMYRAIAGPSVPVGILANNSATPTIGGTDSWIAANSSPTTITNFLAAAGAALESRRILIRATNGNTTIADVNQGGGGNIRNYGRQNLVLATNWVVEFQMINGIWHQISPVRIEGGMGMISGAVLATTAVRGFQYIPTCAGTPTGVPAELPTGAVPMVFDTTGVKVWFYTGGAWKGVVVA